MSSVNAPQPTPDAGAPAEVFDSTITNPPPTVSSLGLPGPTPVEAAVHSGAVNGIDPYLHQQFIATSTFTWNTSNASGTCLYQKPIHPSTSHQFLAHLSRMYNIYSGGIDFIVKVCGTGFHAGALAIVRLPPNFDPARISKPSDFTAFEYKVIDPKTLEVVDQSLIDQRNVMYHYLPLNISDKQTFGGFFAIYVLVPLNTSSSGSAQIAIQIFERPSQNFAFNQLRPLDLLTPQQVVPTELEKALSFTTFREAFFPNEQLGGLHVLPKADRPLVQNEMFYASTFGGMNAYGDADLSDWDIRFGPVGQVKATFGAIPDDPDAKKTFAFISAVADIDPKGDWPPMNGVADVTMIRSGNVQDRLTGSVKVDFTEPDKQMMPASGYNTPLYNKNEFQGTFECTWISAKWPPVNTNLPTFAPVIPESIIVFETVGTSLDVCQPYSLTRALMSGEYKEFMKPTSSLVFQLYDILAELPILLVRLNYNGLMTTNETTTILSFNLLSFRYEFRFLSVIPSSTPLPKTPGALPTMAYRRNRATARALVE